MDKNGVVVRLAPNRWQEPRPASIGPHPGFRTRRVVVDDVKVGSGRPVRPGDWVFADSVEVDYVAGAELNRSWRQSPIGGQVLTPVERMRGLTIGMTGMRPGGRRTIIVPRNLSGTEPLHAYYRKIIYWDVVLRGYFAHGCDTTDGHCRSDRS